MNDINKDDLMEIESLVFKRLTKHLQDNPEVQNIDLMNLANFCRNCLSKWFKAECERKGINIEYDEIREYIYGMPYNEWKNKHQKEATKEQMEQFNKNKS